MIPLAVDDMARLLVLDHLNDIRLGALCADEGTTLHVNLTTLPISVLISKGTTVTSNGSVRVNFYYVGEVFSVVLI